MADSETHLEVKVLVDKLKRRVLFAEADGCFVDILFSFLTLPLGTIVRLIGKTRSEPSTLGGFTALYQSVMSLSNECFLRDGLKDALLHNRSSYEEQCMRLKVNIDDSEVKYFVCGKRCCSNVSGRTFMSVYTSARCPGCRGLLDNEATAKDTPKGKVFVTKALKFIITDDLQVTPVLPRTVIGHLENYNIEDMSFVEERTLKLGINELTELLKLTLVSKSPLTDLFFPERKELSPLTVVGHLKNYNIKDMSFLEEETLKLGINELVELLKLTLVSKRRFLLKNNSEQKELSPLKCSDSVDHRKIKVKMVVNKGSKEFLYYEAGKNFIDLLFSLLLVPLGEMLHMMEGQPFLGSIDGLYKSVQSLDSQYFISEDHKNILLRPRNPVLRRCKHLFPPDPTASTPMSDRCLVMPASIEFGGGNGSEGFVKEDALFIVLDNWVVTPASPIPAISLMSRKKLSVSDLEEKIVSIGIPKGIINILRGSLTSNSAISSGILHNIKEPKQEE